MNGERESLIRYWCDKARDALHDAALLLDAGRANAAVNRLYYACFYAVSGALLSKGLSRTKHSGVRAVFHRHLVKLGVVTTDLGKFFDLLYESRQEGDYRPFADFGLEEVRPWLAKAQEFVECLIEVARRADG